jgi:hypothetical protein
MIPLIANAEQTDLSGSQWLVILICVGVIVVVAALTFVPIAVARSRLYRQADAVTVAALFWGFLTAASVIRFWLARLRWSDELTLRINTGYYDPNNASDAPLWPWLQWGILAVAYGVMVVFTLSRKRPLPPS